MTNDITDNPRDHLKLLLLQVRTDQETCAEEFQEFVRYSGLSADQIDVLNPLLEQRQREHNQHNPTAPYFDTTAIDGYDALLVGGSSDASVLKPDVYHFTRDAFHLLKHCHDNDVPVFSSCYGFQVAVVALGGRIIRDERNVEMGPYHLQLTEDAHDDPLFCGVPSPFWGFVAHEERCTDLPENCIKLAYTARCPVHAFRVRGKPFWGFQFHPELDADDFLARIDRYIEAAGKYASVDTSWLKKIKEESHGRATPHANRLLARFVDSVLLPS